MNNTIEHIDEAVNILMDEIFRPQLGIDEDSNLDDEVYSFVHTKVRAIIIEVSFEFQPKSIE
jgi:hypothetical protein